MNYISTSTYLGKLCPAEAAGVGPLPTVCPTMTPKRRHIAEAATAAGARVRLLSRVRAYVELQVVGAGKAFAAEVTGVGLLAGVHPHVDLQVVGLAEHGAAAFAPNARRRRTVRRRGFRCVIVGLSVLIYHLSRLVNLLL